MPAGRAKGRSLDEFSPLNEAEKKILDAVATGNGANIGEKRPESKDDSITVRAEFLRFLALGGDDSAPVHEKGVWVQGAWITGLFDLSSAEIAGSLVLTQCRFEKPPRLFDAQIRGFFSLEGSHVPGLNAERLICRSSVFLREGFTSTGEIRLLGANIGGDWNCAGGSFANPDGRALIADGIKVGGNVFLSGKFLAKGEARLTNANIGGNLDCYSGSFANPDGTALIADGIKVGGNIFLGGGFLAEGEVRLSGAAIGGTLECQGGNFANPRGKALIADRIRVMGDVFLSDEFQANGEVRLPSANVSGNLFCRGGNFANPEGGALTADGIKVGGNGFLNDGCQANGEVRLLGADIGGDLVCRGGSFGSKNSPAINGQSMTVSGAFVFNCVTIDSGAVTLHAAHVGPLVDDLASWPENSVLDGFVYERFAGNAPTNAKARLAWLDKQSPAHSGKAKNPREFRPQPWLQLRKVLREQGHLEDARQVAIAFEDRKRECGVIGEISDPGTSGKFIARLGQKLARYTARGFHCLYGALIGYGYRPLRLLGIVALVWIFCALFFFVGAHNRVFGPTDRKLAEIPAYPAFYPPLYALDVLLPIAKLGQQDHWAPLNPAREKTFSRRALAWVTQIVVWFEIAFGWIAGLLLAATVTGLTKRHED